MPMQPQMPLPKPYQIFPNQPLRPMPMQPPMPIPMQPPMPIQMQPPMPIQMQPPMPIQQTTTIPTTSYNQSFSFPSNNSSFFNKLDNFSSTQQPIRRGGRSAKK